MAPPTEQGNLFLLFTERLQQAEIPYMVTGSVAGTIYGEPRLTHDTDIRSILKISANDLDRTFIRDMAAELGLAKGLEEALAPDAPTQVRGAGLGERSLRSRARVGALGP